MTSDSDTDHTAPAIQTSRTDGVLVIEICNPPVNAASAAVRQGLVAALQTLQADADLQAGVLMGAGNTFVAGSDLREFGQPMQHPQLPAVIAAIEQCSKPVVAALHGAALGGGLELALGCDARVAQAGTQLGLPEVTLGIIPGAGGTQRLPRRTGLLQAIPLICRGERFAAAQALKLRLVDAVVDQDADLRAHAIAHALGLQGRKQRIRDEAVPAEDAAQIAAAEQAALRAGKHQPAVVAAIAALQDSARLPFDEALARERAAFEALRLSPQALALRHLFFAEREATRPPAQWAKAPDAAPRAVQTVAVIGAGTMGTGIAIAALGAGLQVVLLEQTPEALDTGLQRITSHYAGRVQAGKMGAAQASAEQERLHGSCHWPDIARADLVIEAVFEDLAVKQQVFRQIDQHARAGAVLATNTSYLDVDAIARSTQRPQDVLGLHFFSPANVMKLLEVVQGSDSTPDVLATGLQLGRRLGKLPVLCRNAFGFIGNRIYNAYRRQCEFMLEDGAWPEDVDQAMQAFGMAMGPFAVADLSGLDIAWRMRKAQAATRDPRERYVDILDTLCEQGRLGRKSGAGYYTYADGKHNPVSDDTVRAVIADASARRGIARKAIGPTTIQRRALLAMANEAALLLAQGVALRASDIDVVLAHGYGFPRWEGGPVFWTRQQDLATLTRELQALAQECGHGFVVGDLSILLQP
ncbi:MAG: 3-hydroxyacyl-CoA dehydrogenase NAD-binding domain-containing protein [Comamonas sp.]|nr:3-hydroxyacyl-CoA dehydrogenase NAD-binding domain-containing protein [Comamonas sp.]